MRREILIALVLSGVGCAKPNYVNSAGGSGPGVFEKPTACMGRFASATQECVGIAWEKMPTETAVGSFIFKTFHANLADASPIVDDLPGEIAVTLWMPGMGHGSSPVKVQRLDVGTYRATQVFFTMKGDWEIRIQRKERDEVQDQAIIPINL